MTTRFYRACLIFCLMILSQSTVMGQPLKAMGYLAWWMPQSWQNLPLQEMDRLFSLNSKSIRPVPLPNAMAGPNNGLSSSKPPNGKKLPGFDPDIV